MRHLRSQMTCRRRLSDKTPSFQLITHKIQPETAIPHCCVKSCLAELVQEFRYELKRKSRQIQCENVITNFLKVMDTQILCESLRDHAAILTGRAVFSISLQLHGGKRKRQRCGTARAREHSSGTFECLLFSFVMHVPPFFIEIDSFDRVISVLFWNLL